MKQTLLVGFVLAVFGFVDYALAQQAQERAEAPYEWLNGEWEGEAPLGGILRMNLRVVNGNEVEGKAAAGRRSHPGMVWGKITGDEVRLTIRWKTGSTVNYQLSLQNGTLVGKGEKKEAYFSRPVTPTAE